MGTYTPQDHIDLFGGLPERGEAAIDIRDLADRQRDEAAEFPWQTVAAPRSAVRTPPCGGICGPEGCMARGCPVGERYDVADAAVS